MTRARRDRGRGPSRWWRSVEAIAMGSALASALFAALAALGWRAGDAETNPVPTIVGLTIVALATWRIGRAAKRRAEGDRSGRTHTQYSATDPRAKCR